MKNNLLLIAVAILTVTSCANKNKDYIITIHTSLGDMKVLLYDETPLHKENFIELARTGQYDSTVFHRIIKEFMVQGGGIDMKTRGENREQIPAEIVDGMFHHKGSLAAARQGDQVNPERKSSWCQFYIVQGKKYSADELSAYEEQMNQGAKNKLFGEVIRSPQKADILGTAREIQNAMRQVKTKEEAEVYKLQLDSITDMVMAEIEETYVPKKLSDEQKRLYVDQGGSPHLDGEYTVFGRVVEGLEVIDKLAAVETGGRDKPMEDLYLTMELELISKNKITKMYGYEYPEN